MRLNLNGEARHLLTRMVDILVNLYHLGILLELFEEA